MARAPSTIFMDVGHAASTFFSYTWTQAAVCPNERKGLMGSLSICRMGDNVMAKCYTSFSYLALDSAELLAALFPVKWHVSAIPT